MEWYVCGCVSGSACGCVTECDVTTGTLTAYASVARCVCALALCVNRRHLAAAGHDGAIDVYTTAQRTLLRSIQAHRDAVKVRELELDTPLQYKQNYYILLAIKEKKSKTYINPLLYARWWIFF